MPNQLSDVHASSIEEDVKKVIEEIENHKPWLWEAQAAAKDDEIISYCQLKLVIIKARLPYVVRSNITSEFYNVVKPKLIAHFRASLKKRDKICQK